MLFLTPTRLAKPERQIDRQIVRHVDEDRENNRKLLKTLISSVLVCAR